MDRVSHTGRRRLLLEGGGLALGSAALSSLLAREGRASVRPAHHAPRARSVIYLHMIGAPSQLDLFDPKPELRKRDGEPCPAELLRGKRFAFIGEDRRLAGSPYDFQRHGESGQWLSELLPHLTKIADELAVIRTVHTDEINHAPAQMFLHSGFGRGGRPSFGSWLVYGLGSPADDLPAYVVLLSGPPGGAGASLWSSGFLPGVYQASQFRSNGDPVLFLTNPEGVRPQDRRRVLDAVRDLNGIRHERLSDPEIAARTEQYELAFRMQRAVPELSDLSQESPGTLAAYGVEQGKPSFAANCLLARRLVERGVRMVQLFDSDWDHHADLERRLPAKCRDVDRPMAALIADLRQRGLLDDTLVVWGAEFGRTPIRQGMSGSGARTLPGRDHQKDAYTFWLAGGGVRRGVSHGRTDDFGLGVAEQPVHVHDLNATVLHLLGLDHERLTYRYQGREYRLTDIHGRIIREILA